MKKNRTVRNYYQTGYMKAPRPSVLGILEVYQDPKSNTQLPYQGMSLVSDDASLFLAWINNVALAETFYEWLERAWRGVHCEHCKREYVIPMHAVMLWCPACALDSVLPTGCRTPDPGPAVPPRLSLWQRLMQEIRRQWLQWRDDTIRQILEEMGRL